MSLSLGIIVFGTLADYGPVGTRSLVGCIGVVLNFACFTLVVGKYEPK